MKKIITTGKEIDLLKKYPKANRNLDLRLAQKDENTRMIARKFGKDFFDGERKFGYGGFFYHPKYWSGVIQDRINILQKIKKNKIKNIINFASQGMVEESFFKPLDWYKTNLLSTVDFIEKIKNEEIDSYLHISTPEVYGDISGVIYENTPKKPSTPYAISRMAMDCHLEAVMKVNKFPVKFSRAANVYGEGQQLYRIIPKTILKILRNEKIFLHGKGSSRRSFVHIKDISQGYFKILEKGKIGESYHLSDNNFISIKELVIKICKKLNVNYKKHVVEKNNHRILKKIFPPKKS